MGLRLPRARRPRPGISTVEAPGGGRDTSSTAQDDASDPQATVAALHRVLRAGTALFSALGGSQPQPGGDPAPGARRRTLPDTFAPLPPLASAHGVLLDPLAHLRRSSDVTRHGMRAILVFADRAARCVWTGIRSGYGMVSPTLSESGDGCLRMTRASDPPSRLARLGPSATGTGTTTDSKIRRPSKNQYGDSEAELGGENMSQCDDGRPHGTLCGTTGLNGTLTLVN